MASRDFSRWPSAPHYDTNHLFYVSYTNLDGNSRVAVYSSSGGVGNASSGRTLLAVHQPYSNHNGGQLEFDNRGYLYVGFGDGGSGGDPQQHAQNMQSKLGKLLRSQTKTPDGRWMIVGLGLRNPWRFSFDVETNNLWIADVGQNTWEEVDFRAAANLDKLANYGWSRYEGNSVYAAGHTYSERRSEEVARARLPARGRPVLHHGRLCLPRLCCSRGAGQLLLRRLLHRDDLELSTGHLRRHLVRRSRPATFPRSRRSGRTGTASCSPCRSTARCTNSARR